MQIGSGPRSDSTRRLVTGRPITAITYAEGITVSVLLQRVVARLSSSLTVGSVPRWIVSVWPVPAPSWMVTPCQTSPILSIELPNCVVLCVPPLGGV